ncbi:hypothetical protein [Hymenobacter rigui]|uniref:hypothetical protein n=1 Tax=Hymenobacter rigui TaxID=334424 RepID=UPI0014770127|nr:hypothetical protein [Hymenobacter rigui]
MSWVARLKALFRKPDTSPAAASRSIYLSNPAEFREEHARYLAQHAAELAKQTSATKQAPLQLAEQYGDYYPFFYQFDLATILRHEVLPQLASTGIYPNCIRGNYWSEKHPFNFPGPFYTDHSDTCGTGIIEAPNNVANDADGREFVFRQPHSYQDLVDVLSAAAVEVLDSYAANGNECWTYAACRDWWRNRSELLAALSDPATIRSNNGQAEAYAAYLAGDAETDLRRYCYFLENGQYPATANTALPPL